MIDGPGAPKAAAVSIEPRQPLRTSDNAVFAPHPPTRCHRNLADCFSAKTASVLLIFQIRSAAELYCCLGKQQNEKTSQEQAASFILIVAQVKTSKVRDVIAGGEIDGADVSPWPDHRVLAPLSGAAPTRLSRCTVGFHLHGGTLNKSLCVYGLFLFPPHALIDPFLHGGK